jgi:hypothetical protein
MADPDEIAPALVDDAVIRVGDPAGNRLRVDRPVPAGKAGNQRLRVSWLRQVAVSSSARGRSEHRSGVLFMLRALAVRELHKDCETDDRRSVAQELPGPAAPELPFSRWRC